MAYCKARGGQAFSLYIRTQTLTLLISILAPGIKVLLLAASILESCIHLGL